MGDGSYIVDPLATGHCLKRHITIDTAQSPVIVSIRLIAMIYLAHTDCQCIDGICLIGIGGIHRKRGVTAVMTTQIDAVEPYLGRVPYASEVEEHTFVVKRLRQHEPTDIESLAGLIVSESTIDGLLIAEDSPVGRDGCLVPMSGVVVRSPEARCFEGVGSADILGIEELPVLATDIDRCLCMGRAN